MDTPPFQHEYTKKSCPLLHTLLVSHKNIIWLITWLIVEKGNDAQKESGQKTNLHWDILIIKKSFVVH